MKTDPDMPDAALTPEYFIRNVCIVGNVRECIDQLQSLQQETGGFGTLLMITHDWDDKAKWLHCMELLANQVVPALSD